MNNTKPYLIRAIYEWCVDSHYTPYIAVIVNSSTQVPMEYVENGEIILNVSKNAVNDLIMSNDSIEFIARFNGVPRKMQIPINAVKSIFAKEINQGLTFSIEPEAEPEKESTADLQATKQQKQKKSNSKKPNLQVIK